jgi:hypothetical protein
MQGNPEGRRSAVRSGLVTGISTAAVSGAAAVAGAILSRKFGHGVKAAGFFGAYGVYLALVLVANALRVVVMPTFARARSEDRLGRELGGWCVALAVPLAPVIAVSIAWPGGFGDALTGGGAKGDAAALILPWLVPAAVLQIYAGLAASALATFDDYGIAAFGFGFGAIASLVTILVFVDAHGIVAFGWGLTLSGALALAVPLVPLLARRAIGRPDANVLSRLWQLSEGIALPFALQGLFIVGNRFALGLGSRQGTTFSYAYLIAAFLVAVTASSVALISSVPLVRSGLTRERAVQHVVAASWLSLAVVAAAAGVFALAGETVVRWALGSSYGGSTGSELGRLVVYLAPWMIASVAVSVAFPLLFVRGRAWWLPFLAVAVLGLHVIVEWAGRAAFGLAGLAAGMAITTAVILLALLWPLGALVSTLRGVLAAALVCGGIAALTFALPRVVLGALPSALVGLVLYTVVLFAWRPAGLRSAWAYTRELR